MQKNTMIMHIIEDVIVRREYNIICNEASTKTPGWGDTYRIDSKVNDMVVLLMFSGVINWLKVRDE